MLGTMFDLLTLCYSISSDFEMQTIIPQIMAIAFAVLARVNNLPWQIAGIAAVTFVRIVFKLIVI
jgi:hypothetical protein